MDEGLDDEVGKAFDASLAALSKAGASIESFPFPELRELPAINSGGGFATAESWALHRKWLEVSEAEYDPRVSARIKRGSRQTAADYIDLLDARRRLIESARRRLSAFDAWLMPTIPIVPPLLHRSPTATRRTSPSMRPCFAIPASSIFWTGAR